MCQLNKLWILEWFHHDPLFLESRKGTCGVGRSRGVLGGPDYFCLGAVPRNEGGVKERKECFSQEQIKAKLQMRENKIK